MKIRRWVLLCAAAELLGISAAGIWYAAMNIWIGEPEPLIQRSLAWILMTMAAIPEGLILGGLQAIGIRWFIPDISMKRWILATVLVGLLGWGIGTFFPLFLAPEASSTGSVYEPSLFIIALFASVFGLLVGAVFGGVQSMAFPKNVEKRSSWIWANAIGWAIGLPLIYTGAQIGADFSNWSFRLLAWALGGCGAGISIGIATGSALKRIEQTPARSAS